MKDYYRYITLLLLILVLHGSGPHAFAQTFPVNATVSIHPPYSVYLSDYTVAGVNRISANIILTQVNRTNYNIMLKLKIEGMGNGVVLATKQEFLPAPLLLHGGQPLLITGYDLAEYFDLQHLNVQGISRNQLQKNGKLPEGIYKFSLQVLDYNSGVPVSGEAFALAWLVLNDPPMINLPLANSKITATEPQNVIFQWTPRHLGSPNSAFSTVYDFSLVEIWPAGRNPNDAMRTTPPIYEAEGLNQTTFIYNVAHPALIPGRQYAFRVRARDLNGNDLFKNNGYSEVVLFTYGDECLFPENISSSAINPYKMEMSWDQQSIHSGFTVKYRVKGSSSGQWYTKDTYSNTITLANLKPATEYEYQIQGVCGTVRGGFSGSEYFTTTGVPESDFTCGSDSNLPPVDDSTLKASLNYGDIIKSANFNIVIKEVTGSNGTFSGLGVAYIPMLRYAGFKVAFDNIKVNAENVVFEGNIKSIKSDDSRYVAVFQEDDVLDERESSSDDQDNSENEEDNNDVIAIDTPVDTAYYDEDGDVIIVSAGDTTTVADGTDVVVVGPDNDPIPIGGQPVADNDGDNGGFEGDTPGSGTGSGTGGGSGQPIAGAQPFGPLMVSFNGALPQPNQDEAGHCEYSNTSISFSLSMKGDDIEKSIPIQNALITFKKQCSSGSLVNADISWESPVGLQIGKVGLLDAYVKKVNLNVDSLGNLSGQVGLSASLNKDIQLSSLSQSWDTQTGLDVVLKNGVTGDFAFHFTKGKKINGSWNFEGIHGLQVELLKDRQELARFENGAVSADGMVSGAVTTNYPVSYTSDNITVLLNEFSADVSFSLVEGLESFRFLNGYGKAELSNIKNVTGKLNLELLVDQSGITSTISSTSLKSFGMTLSKLNLKADFDSGLNPQLLYGSFAAKHSEFNTSLKVTGFKIEKGELISFNASGETTYGEHKLKLLQSVYNPQINAIEAEAVLTSTTASSTSMLKVDGFRIYADGRVEMGEVTGDFDSGELFGPVRLTFSIPPQSDELDPEGFKMYKDIKASLLLKMNGNSGENKEVTLTEAIVAYKKHSETAAYKDVHITWSGDVNIGEVGLISARVTQIELHIDEEGKLSGDVLLKAYLDQPIRLSDHLQSFDPDKNIDFVVKEGITGQFKFKFGGQADFAGSWDFMGIEGIRGELIKRGNVIAILQNGQLNSLGKLSGILSNTQPVSFVNGQCKVILEQVSLGMAISLDEGIKSFRVTGGGGEARVSEMKNVEGYLNFAFNYIDGMGYKVEVKSETSSMKAFSMELSDLDLAVALDKDLNLTEISGGVKAMHPKFSSAINIQDFKIERGALTYFNGSGSSKYKGFEFNISKIEYANNELLMNANVLLDLKGSLEKFKVDNFRISSNGEVQIGKIEGKIDKSAFEVDFLASFREDAFKGSFNGNLALVEMGGDIEIGSQEDFSYGYLQINSDLGAAGLPLGPSGLKLTKLGGQIGMNYKLTYKEAGVAPEGKPEKGNYIAGLTLGLADIANMVEVVGNPVVQFDESSIEMTLNGSLNVPRRKPMFAGNLNVNYKIPAQTIDGSIGTKIKIPASSGSVFESNDLLMRFYAGDKKWWVNASNMGGSLLRKINFYNGTILLNSGEISPDYDAPVTGRLAGSVSFSDSIQYKHESWYADVDALLKVSLNSDINVNLKETGLEGSFYARLYGLAHLKVDSAVDFDVQVEGSTEAKISYMNDRGRIEGKLNLKVDDDEYNFDVDLTL